MSYDDMAAYRMLEQLNAQTNSISARLSTLKTSQMMPEDDPTDLAEMPLDSLTADDASLPKHLQSAREEAPSTAAELHETMRALRAVAERADEAHSQVSEPLALLATAPMDEDFELHECLARLQAVAQRAEELTPLLGGGAPAGDATDDNLPDRPDAPTPRRMLRGSPTHEETSGALSLVARRLVHDRVEEALDAGWDASMLARLLDAACDAANPAEREMMLEGIERPYQLRALVAPPPAAASQEAARPELMPPSVANAAGDGAVIFYDFDDVGTRPAAQHVAGSSQPSMRGREGASRGASRYFSGWEEEEGGRAAATGVEDDEAEALRRALISEAAAARDAAAAAAAEAAGKSDDDDDDDDDPASGGAFALAGAISGALGVPRVAAARALAASNGDVSKAMEVLAAAKAAGQLRDGEDEDDDDDDDDDEEEGALGAAGSRALRGAPLAQLEVGGRPKTSRGANPFHYVLPSPRDGAESCQSMAFDAATVASAIMQMGGAREGSEEDDDSDGGFESPQEVDDDDDDEEDEDGGHPSPGPSPWRHERPPERPKTARGVPGGDPFSYVSPSKRSPTSPGLVERWVRSDGAMHAGGGALRRPSFTSASVPPAALPAAIGFHDAPMPLTPPKVAYPGCLPAMTLSGPSRHGSERPFPPWL